MASADVPRITWMDTMWKPCLTSINFDLSETWHRFGRQRNESVVQKSVIITDDQGDVVKFQIATRDAFPTIIGNHARCVLEMASRCVDQRLETTATAAFSRFAPSCPSFLCPSFTVINLMISAKIRRYHRLPKLPNTPNRPFSKRLGETSRVPVSAHERLIV